MLTFIYVLVIAAAVSFVVGGINKVVRKVESTVYYRVTMSLLAFAIVLLLLEMYKHQVGPILVP